MFSAPSRAMAMGQTNWPSPMPNRPMSVMNSWFRVHLLMRSVISSTPRFKTYMELLLPRARSMGTRKPMPEVEYIPMQWL